jgi:hypothetical protein
MNKLGEKKFQSLKFLEWNKNKNIILSLNGVLHDELQIDFFE